VLQMPRDFDKLEQDFRGERGGGGPVCLGQPQNSSPEEKKCTLQGHQMPGNWERGNKEQRRSTGYMRAASEMCHVQREEERRRDQWGLELSEMPSNRLQKRTAEQQLAFIRVGIGFN
jgi:hypothetical protein